jgi:hypothetical protein
MDDDPQARILDAGLVLFRLREEASAREHAEKEPPCDTFPVLFSCRVSLFSSPISLRTLGP